MTIQIEKLAEETREWLDSRARSRGTSIETEAFVLLDDAVHERISRERLFQAAADARIRIPGPPITPEEIEQAINWGRA